MRRSLKKLSQNGEKRGQNGENLHKAIHQFSHKAIYVNVHNYHPPKVFLSETLYVELTKNLIICFGVILAPLLLDTTKTLDSCLLLLNLKQRNFTVATETANHRKPSTSTQNHPLPSKTIHPKTSSITLNQLSPLETTHNQLEST